MSKLRGQKLEWRNLRLGNNVETLPLPKTNALEILAEIDLPTATNVQLEIKSGAKDAQPIVVNFNGSELKVMDAIAPLSLAKGERKLTLHIFIDRSVLEVFANETVCITKIISPLDASATLKISAGGDAANARLVQAWPIKSIW